ncbi:MAG: protein kinase domain-containing protein, partial [Planctomycetota bacterium]
VARTANLIRQTALGVHAAHEHDIIHRDIKPENVLVADEDHVTVLDFGIAKLKSPDSREDMLTLTRKGEIWATPQYMSPEQAMASSDLSARSDIYSLGVVLYESLTGELPFVEDTARALILAHIQKPAPSIRTTRPEFHFPEALAHLVASMLEKRPDARPQSMQEVADALLAYTGDAPAAAPAAPPPHETDIIPAAQPSAPAPAAAPAVAKRATRRPPRIVTVPHGPTQGGGTHPRARDFPVKAHLFVNLGEELHDHIVGRSRVTLGRRTTNDILIPDKLASKLHAELIEDDGRFYVSDLHSRNGTFLDRQRVEGHVSLKSGDNVRIGNTYLLFVAGDHQATEYFAFCAEGHPNDNQARFCGSCGTKVG